MNHEEAIRSWSEDRALLAQRGVTLPDVRSYVPDEFRYDFGMAMDAQPALSTTDPNSAIPTIFTTMVDPKVFRALFAPNKATAIMGEERRGTWVDDTIMLPVTEAAGEVSSYGDYAENGVVTSNTNWPQRQAYLFQVVKQYGERELERAGLARINWVAELDYSAAVMLNKFSNLTYFFGVQGLQNYGLLNDPHLNASLTPAPKAYGGTTWYNSSNQIAATPNEIFADIQNTFAALVTQTAGMVNRETPMVLAMSPQSEAALVDTNSFDVNVSDLIKKNFPNLKVENAVQYGVLSSSNPQGIAGGNFMQLIAKEVDGMETGYCGFNEKMRAHKLIPQMSSYKQKVSAGSWGCILRMTSTISSMIGIKEPFMAETVTVACKWPLGITMSVYDTAECDVPVRGMPGVTRKEFKASAKGAPIKINGPAVPFGQAPTFVIAGGYALTQNVPADTARKWMEQNKDSDLVKNNLIYIQEKVEAAARQAKEQKAVKSGLEPLDVGTTFKNGESLPRDPRWPARVNPNLSRVSSDRREDAA